MKKKLKYYIYKFYHDKELLYIGQTTNLDARISSHKSSKVWWNEINVILYAECNNKFEMDTYEKYYIIKLKPKYNINDKTVNSLKFNLDELNFKIYINNFIKKNEIIPNMTLNKSEIVIQRLNSEIERVYYRVTSEIKRMLNNFNDTEKLKDSLEFINNEMICLINYQEQIHIINGIIYDKPIEI